jgi:hypothetical protein
MLQESLDLHHCLGGPTRRSYLSGCLIVEDAVGTVSLQ